MAASNGSGDSLKKGVFGGTFDPVHNGHIQVAEAARNELGLQTVIFVPAGRPWMKSDRQITPAVHRLKMLSLALRDKPGLEVSEMEISRPGYTYTIDTLRQLKERDRHSELFFILSWNTLEELPLWKEPEEIIKLCRLVTVPRPGYRRPDLDVLETKLAGIGRRVIWLDEPVVDISSTEIRERVARGHPVQDMVAGEVARYILEQRLYRGTQTNGSL